MSWLHGSGALQRRVESIKKTVEILAFEIRGELGFPEKEVVMGEFDSEEMGRRRKIRYSHGRGHSWLSGYHDKTVITHTDALQLSSHSYFDCSFTFVIYTQYERNEL